jgi:hypothetical protein
MTHYEVLGVAPTASATEVRAAYRRAARDTHPDRHGAGSAERMARVNEAWRTLGDPARRRDYDAQLGRALHGTVAPSGSSAWSDAAGSRDSVHVPVPATPARVPWRFMAGMAFAGVALLVIGRLFTSPTPPTGPDNILRAGDCVTLTPSLEAVEVLCSQPYDAVVRVLVPFDQQCPTGTESFRDRQGMGTACVERVAP